MTSEELKVLHVVYEDFLFSEGYYLRKLEHFREAAKLLPEQWAYPTTESTFLFLDKARVSIALAVDPMLLLVSDASLTPQVMRLFSDQSEYETAYEAYIYRFQDLFVTLRSLVGRAPSTLPLPRGHFARLPTDGHLTGITQSYHLLRGETWEPLQLLPPG